MNRKRFKTKSAHIKTDKFDVPFVGCHEIIKRTYPSMGHVNKWHQLLIEIAQAIEIDPFANSYTFTLFNIEWTIYRKVTN